MNFKNIISRLIIIFFIGFLIFTFLNPNILDNSAKERVIPYSEFIKSVENKEVFKVEIGEKEINGLFRDGSRFKTYSPTQDANLIPTLIKNDVVVEVKPPDNTSLWISFILGFAPYLILIFFFWMMFRQVQGSNSQAFSFGRSRARLFLDNKPKVTFADVAGVEEAKQELREVVDF